MLGGRPESFVKKQVDYSTPKSILLFTKYKYKFQLRTGKKTIEVFKEKITSYLICSKDYSRFGISSGKAEP